MAIHRTFKGGDTKETLQNVLSEVLKDITIVGDEAKDKANIEVNATFKDNASKHLKKLKSTIDEATSSAEKLSDSLEGAENKKGKKTKKVTDNFLEIFDNFSSDKRYRNKIDSFVEAESKNYAKIDKNFHNTVNKAVDTLKNGKQKYLKAMDEWKTSYSEYTPKGKNPNSLYEDDYSDEKKYLFNQDDVSKAAKNYENEIRKSGKTINKAISETIETREKLYSSFKTLESQINFNETDFSNAKKNEETLSRLTKMLKISKQIEYLDSKIGMSNSEHQINSKTFENTVNEIFNKMTGKDALSSIFAKQFEVAKASFNSFKKYVDDGIEYGFENVDVTKFLNEIEKEVSKVTNKIKDASEYISNKTSLTKGTKGYYLYHNKKSGKSVNNPKLEAVYDLVGQIANLERNGKQFEDDDKGYQYYLEALKENTELAEYAKIVKAGNTQNIQDTYSIDIEKTKELTEARKKLNNEYERAEKLGINISEYTISDDADIEATEKQYKALKDLNDEKERSKKLGVTEGKVGSGSGDKSGTKSGSPLVPSSEDSLLDEYKRTKAKQEILDIIDLVKKLNNYNEEVSNANEYGEHVSLNVGDIQNVIDALKKLYDLENDEYELNEQLLSLKNDIIARNETIDKSHKEERALLKQEEDSKLNIDGKIKEIEKISKQTDEGKKKLIEFKDAYREVIVTLKDGTVLDGNGLKSYMIYDAKVAKKLLEDLKANKKNIANIDFVKKDYGSIEEVVNDRSLYLKTLDDLGKDSNEDLWNKLRDRVIEALKISPDISKDIIYELEHVFDYAYDFEQIVDDIINSRTKTSQVAQSEIEETEKRLKELDTSLNSIANSTEGSTSSDFLKSQIEALQVFKTELDEMYDKVKGMNLDEELKSNLLGNINDLRGYYSSNIETITEQMNALVKPVKTPENPIEQKAKARIQEVSDYLKDLKEGVLEHPTILNSILLGKDGGMKTKAEFEAELDKMMKRAHNATSELYKKNGEVTDKQYLDKYRNVFKHLMAGRDFGLLSFDKYDSYLNDYMFPKNIYDDFRNNNKWAIDYEKLLNSDISRPYYHIRDNQKELDALQKNDGQDYIALLTEEKDLLQQISDIKAKNENAGNVDALTLDMDVDEAKQRADALKEEVKAIDQLIERCKALYKNENSEYLDKYSGHHRNIEYLEGLKSKLDSDSHSYKFFKQIQADAQGEIFEKATKDMLKKKAELPKELERYWGKLEDAILDNGMSGQEAIEKFNEKAKELGKTFDEVQKKWIDIPTTTPLQDEVAEVKQETQELTEAQKLNNKTLEERRQVLAEMKKAASEWHRIDSSFADKSYSWADDKVLSEKMNGIEDMYNGYKITVEYADGTTGVFDQVFGRNDYQWDEANKQFREQINLRKKIVDIIFEEITSEEELRKLESESMDALEKQREEDERQAEERKKNKIHQPNKNLNKLVSNLFNNVGSSSLDFELFEIADKIGELYGQEFRDGYVKLIDNIDLSKFFELGEKEFIDEIYKYINRQEGFFSTELQKITDQENEKSLAKSLNLQDNTNMSYDEKLKKIKELISYQKTLKRYEELEEKDGLDGLDKKEEAEFFRLQDKLMDANSAVEDFETEFKGLKLELKDGSIITATADSLEKLVNVDPKNIKNITMEYTEFQRSLLNLENITDKFEDGGLLSMSGHYASRGEWAEFIDEIMSADKPIKALQDSFEMTIQEAIDFYNKIKLLNDNLFDDNGNMTSDNSIINTLNEVAEVAQNKYKEVANNVKIAFEEAEQICIESGKNIKDYTDDIDYKGLAEKVLSSPITKQELPTTGTTSSEKLEQDLKDIYQIIEKIESEHGLMENGIFDSGLYSEEDLHRLINLLKEYYNILGQTCDFGELSNSKYFKSSYFNEYMNGVEPYSDTWNRYIGDIEEEQAGAIESLVGNSITILNDATPVIQAKLEEMFKLDPDVLCQHFEDYGGFIKNAIGSDAYYDWEDKLYPDHTLPPVEEVVSTDKAQQEQLKDLQSTVKIQEKWIRSLKDYAGGLSIDEKMPKKEAWEILQRAAQRYYDVVNNPENQFDTMALEKATILYANAYKQAKVSKVADSRLNQFKEPLSEDVDTAQSVIDREYKYRQAALNNALIDIIDVKKQMGEDYSEEADKIRTLTDSYVELRDASIKYAQAVNDRNEKEKSVKNKINEVVGQWDDYGIEIFGYNRYVNTYADVNHKGGKYSDMSAKQIEDYLKKYDKTSVKHSNYGQLAAYAVRLEEQKKDYKEIFRNAGFDEKLINSESFEEAVGQMRQVAPFFEELRQSIIAFGDNKTFLSDLLTKNGLFSRFKDSFGFSQKDFTDLFLRKLDDSGFSEKTFDEFIKDVNVKKFENYYHDPDGQLSFTPLKQDEHSILFGSNNKKEIEETNEVLEGQIDLFEYLNNQIKYFEDSSGQLSFIEQTKEANRLLEEESGQMALFKVEAEKAVDTAIEGQMHLNDYIDQNIEGQMTLNDLMNKDEKRKYKRASRESVPDVSKLSIVKANQEQAQSSTETANIVEANEEKKQEAIAETGRISEQAAEKTKLIGKAFGITSKQALADIEQVVSEYLQSQNSLTPLKTGDDGFLMFDLIDEFDLFAEAGTGVTKVIDTITEHMKKSQSSILGHKASWQEVRDYVSKSKISLDGVKNTDFIDDFKRMTATVGMNVVSKDGTNILSFLKEMNDELGTTFSTDNAQDALKELYDVLSTKPKNLGLEEIKYYIPDVVNQILDGTYEIEEAYEEFDKTVQDTKKPKKTISNLLDERSVPISEDIRDLINRKVQEIKDNVALDGNAKYEITTGADDEPVGVNITYKDKDTQSMITAMYKFKSATEETDDEYEGLVLERKKYINDEIKLAEKREQSEKAEQKALESSNSFLSQRRIELKKLQYEYDANLNAKKSIVNNEQIPQEDQQKITDLYTKINTKINAYESNQHTLSSAERDKLREEIADLKLTKLDLQNKYYGSTTLSPTELSDSKSIIKSNYDYLISKAKEAGSYTSDLVSRLETQREAIDGIGNSNGIKEYTDHLKAARAEFTALQQEERARISKKNKDLKSYEEKYEAIQKYSKAQDELNKLLGKEVEQGKSKTLTIAIDEQKKKVKELEADAVRAQRAIMNMFNAGTASRDQAVNALSWVNNIKSGNMPSDAMLDAIIEKQNIVRSVAAKKQVSGVFNEAFKGTTLDGAEFKFADIDKNGNATLTFLEVIGDKAVETKVHIDDIIVALNNLESGNFSLEGYKTSYKTRNVKGSDFDEFYSNDAIQAKINAYKLLTSTEKKYQELKVKVDNHAASQKEINAYNELVKIREHYNNVIRKTLDLTDEEQLYYDSIGKGAIDKERKKYEATQANQSQRYNALDGVYKARANSDEVKNALSSTEQLMNELGGKNISGFSVVFDDAKKDVEELNSALRAGNMDVDTYSLGIQEIVNSLNNTVAVVKPNNIQEAKSAIDTYVKSIKGASIKDFSEETGRANIVVEKHGQVIREMALEYNKANGQIELTKNVVKGTGSFLGVFTDGLKKRFVALGQYLLSFASFYDVVNKLRNGVTIIRDLDVALTAMRKVSDESVQSLKNFQDVSFDIAGSIGATAKQIQNSTADFMRIGYDLNEASKLAKDANIYANVGDMEIEEATEHMISSIQAWKSEFSNEVEASSAIVDRYNEIKFTYPFVRKVYICDRVQLYLF